MIKRSFFGLLKPRLAYDIIDAKTPQPREIAVSQTIQLLCDTVFDKKSEILLKAGDTVAAMQKLSVKKGDPAYTISPVAGTIESITPYTGNFGARLTSLTIKKSDAAETDTRFQEAAEEPSLQNAVEFLACLPGGMPASLFSESGTEIKTLLISGMDTDLLIKTRQQVVKTSAADIKAGINFLKQITGIESFFLVAPEVLSQEAASTGATVKLVSTCYPSASPRLVLKDILGREVPAAGSLESQGICEISAETVAAIGKAYTEKTLPTMKRITVVDKIGTRKLVSAPIGTPIRDIFSALNIHPADNDRVIIGGPMTGLAAYTLDHPVCADTDAVMVQDQMDIPFVSDNACINCGECVRICPAHVPVNMLVRFLEAGQYDEAADNYDLFSCIDCGLCSYVCTAKIPVFQFIRLAKNELARLQSAEAENV